MGKIATRRAILGAALELFTLRGIHDTSTASIAARAGVATGTLFHHFGSKQELVVALHRLIAGQRRRELAEAAASAPGVRDQLGAMLLADVSWAVDHPDQDRFLRQCRLAGDLVSEAALDDPGEVPILMEVMARGRREGALVDLDPAWLARVFLGLSRALAAQAAGDPALVASAGFREVAVAMLAGALGMTGAGRRAAEAAGG